MTGVEIIEMIYRFGAVPLLMVWVYYLTRELERIQVENQKISTDHVVDLKQHAEEYAQLLEKMLHGINMIKDEYDKSMSQNDRS